MKTGGQLIVEALEVNGVERIYSVPGESYLAVLDAFARQLDPERRMPPGRRGRDDCRLRRATDRPTGDLLRHPRPGATNASPGIHNARQDSNPIDPLHRPGGPRHPRARGLPGSRLPGLLRSIAKWVVEIDDAARIPELVTRAFSVATSGRPGPVVIALPEDMLRDEVDAPAVLPFVPVETRPGEEEMARLARLLEAAERPFVVLGGTRWTTDAVKAMCAALERWKLPVGCSFRRQALCDQMHGCYAGIRRHRHQCEARRLHQGIRPRPPRRLPVRGNALLRLYALEEPLPRPEARPRLPRSGGARPGLPRKRSRSTPRPPPSRRPSAELPLRRRRDGRTARKNSTRTTCAGRRRPRTDRVR